MVACCSEGGCSCVLVAAVLCFVVAVLPHYIRYFPPRRSCRTTNEATNIINDIIPLTLPYVVVAVVTLDGDDGWCAAAASSSSSPRIHHAIGT